jgi:hypothetical protein
MPVDLNFVRPLLRLSPLIMNRKNLILELMFLELMLSLPSSVLLLLLLTKSRQIGHVKSMERAIFLPILNTSRSLVFDLEPGRLLWFVF